MPSVSGSQNAALKVYSEVNGYYYVKVVSTSKYGYIAKKFVEMNEAIDGTIKGSVTANKLALRDGPATTYNYIAGYVKGDTVYIYFKVNGFYYVQTTDGKTGYMSAQYIKASATVPSGTAIPSGTTPKASATAGASATPSTAASAAPTL